MQSFNFSLISWYWKSDSSIKSASPSFLSSYADTLTQWGGSMTPSSAAGPSSTGRRNSFCESHSRVCLEYGCWTHGNWPTVVAHVAASMLTSEGNQGRRPRGNVSRSIPAKKSEVSHCCVFQAYGYTTLKCPIALNAERLVWSREANWNTCPTPRLRGLFRPASDGQTKITLWEVATDQQIIPQAVFNRHRHEPGLNLLCQLRSRRPQMFKQLRQRGVIAGRRESHHSPIWRL